MLYHIDDSDPVNAADNTSATTAASASGIVAAIPAIEASGRNVSNNNNNNNGLMNHVASTPSQQIFPLATKANSVNSLSVGVQYDPRDVDEALNLLHPYHQNRFASSALVEYIPSNGLRRSQHRKSGHIHVSAPDFHISNREAGSQRRTAANERPLDSSLHHHHHHHHHHKSSASTSREDFFLATSTTTSQQRRRSSDFNRAYFGSLGRSQFGGGGGQNHQQISLSESEPDGWPMQASSQAKENNNGGGGLTGLHPPPMKSARLSSDSSMKRTPAPRRYGSIRVAECRFVEAAGSQPSTPTASLCESSSFAQRPPYHQYPSYGISLPSPASTSTSSLPPPPMSLSSVSVAAPAASSLCNNGPLSGLSSLRGGSNGQHSHIIPPPQNFSNNGEYATLTTTRIGSASRLPLTQNDLWSYQRHHHLRPNSDHRHHNHRLDSPY